MNAGMVRARGPKAIAALCLGCILAALAHQLLVPVDVNVGWAFRGFIGLIGLPYVVLGATILGRSPENRIGRLLQVIGVMYAVAYVLEEYALHGLVYRPGSLPAAIYAAWVLQWAWIVMFGVFMFVFLVYPNGRFLSDRWRRFSYFGALSIVVCTAGLSTAEGVLDSFTERPAFQNPLAIEGWKGESAEVLLMVWVLSLVGSASSLFIRYRRSIGVERLQLKWLAVGGLLTTLAFVFAAISESISRTASSNAATLAQTLVTLGIGLLPVTIGAAILRYRLYDIDVLINRALVYSLLTVALALAYIGLVFGFQTVLAPFTAQSDLAIAGSTLAVAALFRPVRARVQDFIDKRFYRQKFDAQRTVDEFNSHLRDEVDLAAISGRLVDVVSDTMQPVHASIWLRGTTR
jgi:hypothetical protein